MATKRDAYLEALGLTPWVRRGDADAMQVPGSVTEAAARTPSSGAASAASAAPAAKAEPRPERPNPAPTKPQPEPQGVVLGPGQGDCLYVCGSNDDTAGPLASDLARVPGESPVWALVAADGEGDRLEAAIAERLFTQVVVFGAAQAQLVFGGDAPDQCGPARVTVVPDLDRLARDARARRQCWALLKGAGIVPRP